MKPPFTFPSLVRISDLPARDFEVRRLERARWRNGDYVAAEIDDDSGRQLPLELCDGRMSPALIGDQLIGALGVRYATLEATGTWEAVGDDGAMHILTGAGLLGKLTSKSAYVPAVMSVRYIGHVFTGKQQARMQNYAARPPAAEFDTPVMLITGTSMSAGKTTAARVLIRQLKRLGLRVAGAKLTGAGRYKDILAMRDAGADAIFDFVDAGLPSSIAEPPEFMPALETLVHLITGAEADIAVIEIGASPLEPYNGQFAVHKIRDQICYHVLCASDPYAVLGVMTGFDLKPDLVSGPAVNTLAGQELVEKLCHVRALNLIDPTVLPELRDRLSAIEAPGLNPT